MYANIKSLFCTPETILKIKKSKLTDSHKNYIKGNKKIRCMTMPVQFGREQLEVHYYKVLTLYMKQYNNLNVVCYTLKFYVVNCMTIPKILEKMV